MKRIILLLGIVLISLTLGFYFVHLKKSAIISSAPSVPPSLNAYGKLIDISQGKRITLKIHPEIVNYRFDNQPFTVEISATAFIEVGPSRKPLNLSELSKGNNYVFYFRQNSYKKGPWDNLYVSEDVAKYREEGAWLHGNDLGIDPLNTEKLKNVGKPPSQSLISRLFHSPKTPMGIPMKIIRTVITPGQLTELKILLINNQKTRIRYKIIDAKIVNEQAFGFHGYWWQLPPYKERLENATINELIVTFDASEDVIEANSTKLLTFTVTSPQYVNVSRTYEIYDSYEQKKNRRLEMAGNRLLLWGKIEYTDVLGNKHLFPESGVLKQFLRMAS